VTDCCHSPNPILRNARYIIEGVIVVEIKWALNSEVDLKRDYLVYAGYAERKTSWSYFSYLMKARKVQNQLKKAKGFIGFTARLEFFTKKVVQLAVFEDTAALKEFAHAGHHAHCMETTKSSMKWLKQATWNIAGSAIPPKIDDAISRIQSKN
jgi:hypothetical protein